MFVFSFLLLNEQRTKMNAWFVWRTCLQKTYNCMQPDWETHWEGRFWSWRQGMLPNILVSRAHGQLISNCEVKVLCNLSSFHACLGNAVRLFFKLGSWMFYKCLLENRKIEVDLFHSSFLSGLVHVSQIHYYN